MEMIQEVLQRTPLNIRRRARSFKFDIGYEDIPLETMLVLMNTLPLLPKLEVLRIDGWIACATDRELATHLVYHLPNLKLLRCHLEFEERESSMEPTAHRRYLAIPGLTSFSGTWTTRSDILHLPSIDNRTLTHLSLTFEWQTDLPIRWLEFPALRSFGATAVKRHQNGLLRFLEVNGARITALFLCLHRNATGKTEMEILDRCPNVHEFVRQDFQAATETLRTYPSVVRFAVADTIPMAEVGRFTPGPGHIHKLYRLDRFPNLKVVRLLATDYESPSPRDCPQKVIRDLLSPRKGIVFEDAFGCLIPEPNAET